MTALQQFRLQLRRAARVASQFAEAFEFLGFDFAAQLARVVCFAALLTLALVEFVVRAGLRLTVVSVRFLRVRLVQLAKALFDADVLFVLGGCLVIFMGIAESNYGRSLPQKTVSISGVMFISQLEVGKIPPLTFANRLYAI
ncbi:MAG: hypothetical protein CMF12_08730 [Idiomarina sp.]|mgnify:FL=1|uniref:hypothetical protein n=1 Tax=Idiomarina sp. TaxID=1874361 RepID=UPI000C4BBB2C|nr:hypothetical protein [Idiomarina sp.]MBT42595.1 hypothetical protein [Idiomarina sp.]|tara:strand:+ start:446 stop:871 length:426 start_codon:yes stop_codon:yes gene_type:complete